MKYWAFVITVLASIGFFNYHNILGGSFGKLVFCLCVVGSLIVAMTRGANLRGVRYPRICLIVVLVTILGSAFMATAFHPQSIGNSISPISVIFLAYLFFFVMMKLDIPRKKIINTYILLCGIATVVYFINLRAMPAMVFGKPLEGEDISRGILRIPVVFIEMFPLLCFYGINQWIATKRKKWLWLIGLSIVMIVLSVVRQIIVLTFVLGLLFFLRKISLKWKILMVATIAAIVVWVLPMIPVYRAMIDLSERQIEINESKENPRIAAWRFYTYENQTNDLSPIFGNGTPSFGKSRWGKIFESVIIENGCFAADVGWAGYFWYFGGISTVALLLMMLSAFMRNGPDDRLYLRYWFAFIIITSAASGPILYYHQIISISVCLYLVFKKEDSSNGTVQLDKPRLSGCKTLYPQF